MTTNTIDELVHLLDLEQLEVNLFRGTTIDPTRARLYGGEVLGQALMAAGRTVDPDPVLAHLGEGDLAEVGGHVRRQIAGRIVNFVADLGLQRVWTDFTARAGKLRDDDLVIGDLGRGRLAIVLRENRLGVE